MTAILPRLSLDLCGLGAWSTDDIAAQQPQLLSGLSLEFTKRSSAEEVGRIHFTTSFDMECTCKVLKNRYESAGEQVS